MKKTKMISSFLLAVVLCLATFVGFAKNTTATNANALNEEDDLLVGVSLPLYNEEMAEVGSAMESLFTYMGFTVLMFDSEYNPKTQVEQIKSFIAQNVDAIVVMPVDEQALVNPLTEAAQQDIAVIVFGPNNGLYPSAVYVDFDYEKKAECQVDSFIKENQDPRDYKILVIACNNEHGQNYYKWVMDSFKKYSNYVVSVIFVDDPMYATTAMNAWISENSVPDAIYVCCGARGMQVVGSLEELGFTYGPDGVPIYGLGIDCSCNFKNLAKLIFNLILKIKHEVITPTGDEAPFIADYCGCIYYSSGCECEDGQS